MPLPWLMIFFFIFSCFYSVVFYMSFFSFSSSVLERNMNSSHINFPW